jgi:hypothetical protein
MSQENSSHRFSVNVERFKALGIVDPRSKSAHDAYDHHEFSSSERLFFKIWGNEQLNAGIFSPGQKVAEKGEHPVLAQVIISGEVVVSKGSVSGNQRSPQPRHRHRSTGSKRAIGH